MTQRMWMIVNALLAIAGFWSIWQHGVNWIALVVIVAVIIVLAPFLWLIDSNGLN
jgi:hypothetical protein